MHASYNKADHNHVATKIRDVERVYLLRASRVEVVHDGSLLLCNLWTLASTGHVHDHANAMGSRHGPIPVDMFERIRHGDPELEGNVSTLLSCGAVIVSATAPGTRRVECEL